MIDPPNREVTVFTAALQLPAQERAAFLAEVCAGDTALRQGVEAFLRAYEEAGIFLEDPAPGAQRPVGAAIMHGTTPTPSQAVAPREKAGDRIGRYKLLQQIGEGGCGIVYMAEQAEPVRRRVALKVVKLGMDTKSVIARFEAERQALALMDHPNIAKVLDAGATETGRPFFVMELVRGIKITDYCDENSLATRERLELFVKVCQAIQHAHQKGIIHRDIKPSNILVTVNDGVAVPKVIDFGIAKATTDQRLTDKTVFTVFEQFIGTPAYMSPEQSAMTSLDIDTRSDIYALGVLLYELLTGKTPFDAEELLRGGLKAMQRTICEAEPVRPSTRFSTMLEGDRKAVARHRQAEAPKLVELLRGDLDWIVMKCLEKDRTRRYATANGLAFDIQRHLNNEPVNARPPSRLYQFQKLVRRNGAAFAAGLAITVALLAGLVVSTYLFVRESRARQRAQAAEQRAQQGELAARQAQQRATDELWRSYLAQALASRFSGQPGRRFDSLDALTKAAAIRFAPELRDEAIACLALVDLKLQRRIEVRRGVLDSRLQRYAMVSTNNGDISLRQVGDDRELFRLPHSGDNVAWIGRFSPDGNLLAVWGLDHRLRFWDLDRRAEALTVPFDPDCDFDFAPDGQQMAIVSGAREVSIYDLANRRKLQAFPTAFVPRCVRYDPSGRRLAICSPATNVVTVLHSSSGAILLNLTNGEGFNQVAWHPREPLLAGAGEDNLVYLWDTAAGRLLRAFKGHENAPGDVAFSREGDLLVSGGWDGLRVWQVRNGEPLLHAPPAANCFQFGPDGASFGYARYDLPHSLEQDPRARQALEVVTLASGREAGRWRANEEDANHKVCAFSPDGRWLAFGAGEGVELFDTRTSALLGRLPTGPPLGVCFQKSGGGLLVSGERGLFRWPVHAALGTNGKSDIGPPQSVGPAGAWQQASLSENGQVFAAFHGDRLWLFEGETLRELAHTDVCGDPDQYRYISVSADGRWVATGGWHDSVVRIWNATTGSLVKVLADPDWAPMGSPYPAFEPKGSSLIVSFPENYQIWETNSWTPGPCVPYSGWGMTAVSRQNGLLAMRHGATAIQLRDALSGELLATLQSPVRDTITELVFSPDDTLLAVIHNTTRELLVWDLRLLREELAKMGMDWARPPYPPAMAATVPSASQVRVLTNAAAGISVREAAKPRSL